MPGPYLDEFRQRALRMLSEARPDHKTDHAAIKHVAAKLGVNPETLRLWKKRVDVDDGRQPGTSSEAQAEIKRLKKQVAELEKLGERVFRDRARPPLVEMIAFVDKMRDRFGVELVCRVMRQAEVGFLAARGYRVAKARPASARQLRDELLIPEITRLHAENYGVYAVRKMHALLRRQGWVIGRDQTGRLMRIGGVHGVKRSKRVFTTRPDPANEKPRDLVQRRFTADAPRRLWVADVTYVATWSGFAYVAFVTDVFSRRIVGWNVASTLKADILSLQALNMAAWAADENLDGLVHHADHGLDMRTPAEVEADYYAGLDTPLGTPVSQDAR